MFNTIKEEIDVVFERDPAARSVAETIFTCPGFQAIVFHRFNHWLWDKKLYLIEALCQDFLDSWEPWAFYFSFQGVG